MRINNNISAMNTYSRLNSANNAKSGSLAKLSSGLRINRAGDDAAGLAISEKMRGQIGGLKQATRNAQDGISLIQTAEGGLNETHSILNRMRELAVQSSNDTNTDSDRNEIQKEMNELATEMTRISKDTEFNTQGLLDGSLNSTFHIGSNKGQNLKLEINDMSSSALNVAGTGKGKANYEVKGTDVTIAATNLDDVAIAAGDNKLNAVKIDQVTVGGAADIVANYGLENEKGEIVAISKDGAEYTFLKEATKASELATASAPVTADKLVMNGKVTSGEVTFKAATDGKVTDIKATASLEVSGLKSGDYTVKMTDAADITKYFGTGDGKIASHASNDENVITSVLLNADGKVAGVGLAVGTVGTDNANKFYAIGDIDLTKDGSSETDNIVGDAKAALSKGAAIDGTEKYTIQGSGAGIDVSSQEAADAAIKTISDAIDTVSAERSKLGATQNRLDHTINNLTATAENLSEAESRIRDVDMAEEMMTFTKNNILSQAATSMLAQANQMPQSVLQLLQ